MSGVRRGPVVLVAASAGFLGAIGFQIGSSHSSSVVSSKKLGTSTNSSPPTTTSPAGGSSSNSTSSTSGAGATVHTQSPQGGSGNPQSATGTTENYGYGRLAVRATVSGNKITSLTVVGLQTQESYSYQIAQQAIPMLKNEVLSAQSYKVNGVSGATYTSLAYLYSLQSALDKLHFK